MQLCDLFLGSNLRLLFMGFLTLYMYGTLWAYATVFANAMASNLPYFGEHSYMVYLLGFGCIVAPMSCLELKEQISFQVLLSIGRVLMVFFLVSTVLISHYWGSEADFGGSKRGSKEIPAFDLGGIHHLLPIATFANIFHHSIPALSQPVIDKTKLASIFSITLLCCFAAYSCIGLTVSLYFGENTKSSSNLNWADYGINTSNGEVTIKRMISLYVVLFPALDVSSAYPLNAITLGNNLLSTVYGNDSHTVEHSRAHRLFFRLSAALPPLLAASCVSDLGFITDYTGISGFGIAFIFPALLSYYSFQRLKQKGLPTETAYSNILTTPSFGLALIFFGIFLLFYVPYSLNAYPSEPS